MAPKTFDVAVVGGGIVGLMSAYRLNKAGAKVCVLDAGDLGLESSWAGGGIVCPVPPWHYDPWVEETTLHSRSLFAEWLPDIETISGIDCEYRVTGLLLSGDPARYDFVADAKNWMLQTAEVCQLGRRFDFEQRLPEPDWPAVWLPKVPQVRNSRLMQALISTLSHHGVTLCTHSPIHRVLPIGSNGLELIGAAGDRVVAQQVVLASGAWTDDILQASGLAGFGIRPIRGQMLLYQLDPMDAPQAIINTGEGYLIPRADGHILAGSTVEDVGFDRTPTQEAYWKIKNMAGDLWPALATAPVLAHWWGFRPGLEGSRPLVGTVDGAMPGLFMNAGHYRNGLGLAPACAEQLAQAMGWV